MRDLFRSRGAQVLAGTAIVSVLVLAVSSIGVASVIGSADAADAFVRSSVSSKMYASDGSMLANLHGEIDRDPVPLERIPLYLRRAAVAIEDRRFYSHSGIDIRGTLRALLNNLRSGAQQGGSTITQQLAKNLYFHGQPRTVVRKAAEAVIAIGLETLSTKDQILDSYLNTAYFGRGAYGVQAASHAYFRKDVSRLTLAQSAFLAGLIHAPARYDFTAGDAPVEQAARRRAAIARRNVVLDTMAGLGYIGRSTARRAAAEPLSLKPPRDPRWRHPYFVDAVLRELGVLRSSGETRPDPRFAFLGETHSDRARAVYRKGLRIYTTLDPRVQGNGERALARELPSGDVPKLSAALVSVEPGTGYVRALIGGRDYYPTGCDATDATAARPVCRHAKVNLALGNLAGGSGRQPGSSFKPVVLAAALEDGMSLRQTVNSSPFSYHWSNETWTVHNYEGDEGGTIDVVDAMVHSVNAAYARIEIEYLGDGSATDGSARVARMARKLGIAFPTERSLRRRCGDRFRTSGACTPADDVPSIAIGSKEVSPLQMAGAYATFAADGVYARPTLITKITDAKGNVLYTAHRARHRAMSSATARGVSYVLQQVVRRGTGRAAALDRPVAGKTGTSQAWRDAWFDGYVPQLATVVWVGNPVPVPGPGGGWTIESMTPSNGYGFRVVGATYPARIWHAAMEPAVSPWRARTFAEPPSSLFHEPKVLKDVGEIDIGSDLAAIIDLRRQGYNVIVHTECPPEGRGRGIRNWKAVQNGDVTEVWRSRAVCR